MPTDDFAQLSLQFVDQTQWRYEVIRPLILLADRTPRQRAHETDTHPATVRALARRFRGQGMLGLLPEDVHTWPEPPLPPWGVKSTHLHRSAGRHLPRAVMPKYLKDKTQI